MTSRDRMLAALTGMTPDRLPATTHHVMPSFLAGQLGGASTAAFFERFGLDAIDWVVVHRPTPGSDDRLDPDQGEPGFLEPRLVVNDRWLIRREPIPAADYVTTRYRFVTPGGELTMVVRTSKTTSWVAERLIKRRRDIDVLGSYLPSPACDVGAVNRAADATGSRGIVRGHICGFDVFGQPGVWQDAACLVGIETLILATYDDPAWVHGLLRILERRKVAFARSLAGARYDLVELGGGDASSTVISPRLFDQFVAPYDIPIIEAAHAARQRVVYNTCGGMMPILSRIAAMGPDAMETFTPPDMGGDADLARAREVLGDGLTMIGGFDQAHFLSGCRPDDTRAEIRRIFEAAARRGRYILAPSDHFFEADLGLLHAFADEAARCVY